MNRIGKKTLSTECRHPVTFQQNHPVPDGGSGYNDAWVNFLPAWAAIYPYRAEQVFNFRSINVEATHLVKTRGYLQLTTKTKWAGQIWNVTWSGVGGITVQIHYQINGGSFVLISASEPNTGLYQWTIPDEAVGKNVKVRVTNN